MDMTPMKDIAQVWGPALTSVATIVASFAALKIDLKRLEQRIDSTEKRLESKIDFLHTEMVIRFDSQDRVFQSEMKRLEERITR